MTTHEDPRPTCPPAAEAGQHLPRPDDAVAEYWNLFEAVHGAFADQHQIL